jgi:hypothetical protein
VALLSCMAVGVAGHMRWVYPAPRNSDSGLKSYPCGSVPPVSPSQFTVLSPGVITVEFVETINHAGSPVRIALSLKGDETDFEAGILVDHAPHNDAGAVPKSYLFNITIPNVNWSVSARPSSHSPSLTLCSSPFAVPVPVPVPVLSDVCAVLIACCS